MYLARPAIARTLAAIGSLAPGTELVADYIVPEDLRDAPGRAYARQVAPAAAERGEPWLSLLRPDEMTSLLSGNGFGPGRQVPQRRMVPDRLWDRTDTLCPAGLAWLAGACVPDEHRMTG